MKQPKGFEHKNSELVCRLNKGIYGLKQGAKVWNDTIDLMLKELNFRQSNADNCLYIRESNGFTCYILIYVDDMIIATKTNEEYLEIVGTLQKQLKLTVLGEPKLFLGIHVERINNHYRLSQSVYIEKVLKSFGMSDAKISKIPMDSGYIQQKEEEKELENNEKYRSLIGALLYIAVNTRPDIAIATSILGRKVSKPMSADWIEAKRVLRYLKGTKELKLTLSGNDICKLSCYVDADWAGERIDRKSNSGFVVQLGGSIINWASRKQSCVALSSTEAEFVALSECCQELLWTIKLMEDFGLKLEYPITIMEDNQSCMKMVNSDKIEKRSKHIDTKFHFVKDLNKTNLIKLQYCSTEDMIADILTKPLQRIKLEKFRESLGLKNI